MNDSRKVALLIDFENLVLGLENMHGEEYAQHVDPEILFRLAEEYGQVVLANAYADWRSRDFNQFQTDLYRLGIDLVHVFAKRQQSRLKNAVDVKMAVDAVEAIWTLPHIDTFVIVSGDRDFIHVLKALRRHGKTVVGISPDQSVSEDFASLCDRFVRYGALLSTHAPRDGSRPGEDADLKLASVRNALREILVEHPEGMKGARIKPLLRRHLSAAFDESEYGFAKLSDLLLALPDVVEIKSGAPGGDISVFAAHTSADVSVTADSNVTAGASLECAAETLSRAADLPRYGFDSNCDKRRHLLCALFRTMKSEQPFTLQDVFDRILDEDDTPGLSTSRLARYQTILWQSRCFAVEPDQQDKPMRQRLMRVQPEIATEQDLIRRYEASVAYKLNAASTSTGEHLTTDIVRTVLGLPETLDSDAYCTRLLEQTG